MPGCCAWTEDTEPSIATTTAAAAYHQERRSDRTIDVTPPKTARPLQGIVRFKFHEGKVEEFKRLAQDLLRAVHVQTGKITRQAAKGADHIDSPLLSRTVSDLATLQRIDLQLMLQVGRQSAGETSEEAKRRAQDRAEATVDEYATVFERDLARFTGEKAP